VPIWAKTVGNNLPTKSPRQRRIISRTGRANRSASSKWTTFLTRPAGGIELTSNAGAERHTAAQGATERWQHEVSYLSEPTALSQAPQRRCRFY